MGLYIGKMDRKWLSRVLIIMLADILGILGSYLLALWARFDLHFMDIPPEFLQGYLSTIWWWVLICLAVFWLCNLYNSIWRFVSVDALMRIILAYVILGGLSFGCVKLFHIVMPRSYYVWGLLCSFFITAGIRFFYRGVRYLRNRVPGSQKGTENVMIIGAGQAGRQLIREYAVSSHLNSRVACLIDDNPAKRGRILEGVRIVGGRRDIPQAVKRYDIRKIIFAIPSLQGAGRQEILNICSKTGCQIQVVPGIYQLVKGEVTISKLRRVELQDLLGRDPIRVNLGEICGYINDKTVLITGGGGSIGSELCRQIARHKPRRLVIFDIYENNAYDIQMELRRGAPGADAGRVHRFRPGPGTGGRSAGHLSAGPDLPRGGPQACAADGGQPQRGHQEQRIRYIQHGPVRRGPRGEALRADLHGQGREPHQHHGGLQAPV